MHLLLLLTLVLVVGTVQGDHPRDLTWAKFAKHASALRSSLCGVGAQDMSSLVFAQAPVAALYLMAHRSYFCSVGGFDYLGKHTWRESSDRAFSMTSLCSANRESCGLLFAWRGFGNGKITFMSVTRDLSQYREAHKVIAEERSSSSVALSTHNELFITAWPGMEDRRLNFMVSQDGRHWRDKLIFPEKTKSGPTLASFQGKIFLAWRGEKDKICIMRTRNDTETIKFATKTTFQKDSTKAGPFLLSHSSGVLVLAFAGLDGRINLLVSENGVEWVGRVVLRDTTRSTPVLVEDVQGHRLFLIWHGMDGRLNIMYTTDGPSFMEESAWERKATFEEATTLAPSAAYLPQTLNHVDHLLLGWVGTNGQLNSLLLDNGRGLGRWRRILTEYGMIARRNLFDLVGRAASSLGTLRNVLDSGLAAPYLTGYDEDLPPWVVLA